MRSRLPDRSVRVKGPITDGLINPKAPHGASHTQGQIDDRSLDTAILS